MSNEPSIGNSVSTPAPDTSKAWKESVADLAVQLLRSDTVLRVAAVFAVVWVWLTLVGLTVSLTNEINSGRDLLGLASLIAAVPATVTWLRLLRLTKLTVDVLQLMLRGLLTDSPSDSTVRSVKRELGEPFVELLGISGRWAQSFINSWITVLIVKAVVALVSSGFMLMRFGSEFFHF